MLVTEAGGRGKGRADLRAAESVLILVAEIGGGWTVLHFTQIRFT